MREFKGAGGRGGLRGRVTGRPLTFNAVALALRRAQLVPRGKAGEGVALTAAADRESRVTAVSVAAAG